MNATTSTPAPVVNNANKKKSFHIEKLRSLAFKTLMHSLRNEFNQIVPEHAQQELLAVHVDLLDFMTKAFFFIPKITPAKKNSLDTATAKNAAGSVRKATLSEIFGFNSFNKQFRERVFGDYTFAMPLLLILENYRHYRTKFREEFVGIFAEFKALCQATVSDFDAAEDLYKLKRQAAKSLKCGVQQVDLTAFKLERFAAEYNLPRDLVEDLVFRAKNGDLFNVFLTVVKRIESPLSVYGLKQCFELYVSLLKIKHYESSVAMPAHKEAAMTKCATLQSNASTGIPSESSTPRNNATSNDYEFVNPIEQLIHEISVTEDDIFASAQGVHNDFFKTEPEFIVSHDAFGTQEAECSDFVFTETAATAKLCDVNTVAGHHETVATANNFFVQDFDLGNNHPNTNQTESFMFPEIY